MSKVLGDTSKQLGVPIFSEHFRSPQLNLIHACNELFHLFEHNPQIVVVFKLLYEGKLKHVRLEFDMSPRILAGAVDHYWT